MATPKVLVVEDDQRVLEFIGEVLLSLGAEVTAYSDSEQALQAINEEGFAGIFLDLQMPGLDGLALSRHVRCSAWNSKTPVVIVTGNINRMVMQSAFRAGATFYIEKPVDRAKIARLFMAIRSACAARQDALKRVS